MKGSTFACLAASALLLASLPASAQFTAPCDTRAARAADKWFGDDKALHAGGSAALGVLAATMTDSEAGAFAIAMVPGVLKEISDRRTCGNFFSVKDLAADALGAYLGVKFGRAYIVPIGGRNMVGVAVQIPLD